MTNVAQPAGVIDTSAPPPVIELVQRESTARAVARVLAEVWSPTQPIPPELVWVLAHTGNYVAAARVGGEVVGAAVALRAVDSRGAHLHSHITGVLPSCQGRSLGFRLKRHQRAWALRAGLERITWTFDPLVARNTYFNVTKLGAELTGYRVNFYGSMADGVNGGDESDRAEATWWLSSPTVLAALRREPRTAPLDVLAADQPVSVLAPDAAGWPVVVPTDVPTRLVQVPADIVGLRRRQPAQAAAWRLALREVLADALAAGLRLLAVTRDGRYLLAATGSPTPAPCGAGPSLQDR